MALYSFQCPFTHVSHVTGTAILGCRQVRYYQYPILQMGALRFREVKYVLGQGYIDRKSTRLNSSH